MSRESEERKAMLSGIEDSPRGAGDPDFYGYPGEPKIETVTIGSPEYFEAINKALSDDVPF